MTLTVAAPPGAQPGQLIQLVNPIDGAQLTCQVPPVRLRRNFISKQILQCVSSTSPLFFLCSKGLGPSGQFQVRVPKPTLLLSQLNAMGFSDEQKNLAALQQAKGNVELAVNILVS